MEEREKTCVESCGLKSLKAVQRSGIGFAEYQQSQAEVAGQNPNPGYG